MRYLYIVLFLKGVSKLVEAEILGISTSNVTHCGNRTCYHNAVCSRNDGQTCICRHGYDGVSCQEDVNECEVGSPCYHRGHCNNTFGSWECTCLEGWTNGVDKHCENKTNPDIRYRRCIPGWMGDMCQDRCLNDSMCGQNQHCKRRGRGLQCLCKSGWEGEDCSTDVNECEKKPCKYRQVCLNTGGSFTCECQGGWKGLSCSVDVDECKKNPCKDHQVCLNTNGSFTCECQDGWNGPSCAVDVDECRKTPCTDRQVCLNTDGSFTCECKDGWQGPRCSVDVNECSSSNPCKNSDSCINNDGSYQCICVDGWMGKNCEEDLDECQNEPCNASYVCNNQPGTFSCHAKSADEEVRFSKRTLLMIIAASVGSTLLLLGLVYVLVAANKKCKRSKRQIKPEKDVILDTPATQTRVTRVCPVTRLGFEYEKDKPEEQVPNLDF